MIHGFQSQWETPEDNTPAGQFLRSSLVSRCLSLDMLRKTRILYRKQQESPGRS